MNGPQRTACLAKERINNECVRYPMVSESAWQRLMLLVRILNFEPPAILAGTGDDQEAVKERAMLRLQQAGTIVK